VVWQQPALRANCALRSVSGNDSSLVVPEHILNLRLFEVRFTAAHQYVTLTLSSQTEYGDPETLASD
jgi:hypothetical protein